MLVETVVCKIKYMRHRAWRYFQMHLAWTAVAFNLMLDLAAKQPREAGQPQLSIADYVL